MRFIVVILVLISSPLLAQFSTVKRVLDNIEEGDVEKAYELLTRAIEKDSLDPGIQYAFSRLYDSPLYPRADPDSAYFFIQRARREYLNLDLKEVDKLRRVGIDSLLLEGQKLLLDSQAFEAAKEINTVASYQEFMLKHPTSEQYQKAIKAEQDAAYRDAAGMDTHEAYREYMESYPKSAHFQKAMSRYEELLFVAMTKDGKLMSYVDFLKHRPNSPFREIAERHLYEISTAGNRISDVKSFLRLSQSETQRGRALDILYHVLKETNSLDKFENQWFSDSLMQIHSLDLVPLLPIIEDEDYQFIDAFGKQTTIPPADSIFQQYLCEPVVSDIIVSVNSIETILSNRLGSVVWKGSVDEIMDLGYGILKVQTDGKIGIVHKRGEQVLPCIYEDVKVIGSAFIATKMNGRWGLASFVGKEVLPNDYDEITPLNGSIIIRRGTKIAVSNVNTLKTGADGDSPQLVFIYDEFEDWPDQKIWVKSSKSEGLINSESLFDIPLSEHEIVPTRFGYILYGEVNSYLNSDFVKVANNWNKIQISDSFAKVESEQGMFLLSITSGSYLPFDSIALWGNHFAVVKKKALMELVFSNHTKIPMQDETLSLIANKEDEYLLLRSDKSNFLYNKNGELVYEKEFDKIKAIGNEYFVVSLKGKEGLISSDGSPLLPVEYDAFGGYEDGGVSVLKGGKLGYFHARDSVWIKPMFDRKIIDTRNGWFVVEKDDKKKIADLEGSIVEGFEFDEIFAWNDSSYLVREAGSYAIFNLHSQKRTYAGIREIRLSAMDSKGLIVRGNDGFGMIHPQKGVIIPPIYTFLTPVGEFIRAEKYIKEADYYLSAYYNLDGKLIYRAGLTPDQNEMLICDN